jgi:hypothetical protein
MSRRRRNHRHEFQRRLLRSMDQGLIDGTTAVLVEIRHDGDCQFLKGGVCACDPEMWIDVPHGGRVWLAADGGLRVKPPKVKPKEQIDG